MDGQGNFSMAGSTGFGSPPHTCDLLSKDVAFLQVLTETQFAAWSSCSDWLSRVSSVTLHSRDTVVVCVCVTDENMGV